MRVWCICVSGKDIRAHSWFQNVDWDAVVPACLLRAWWSLDVMDGFAFVYVWLSTSTLPLRVCMVEHKHNRFTF